MKQLKINNPFPQNSVVTSSIEKIRDYRETVSYRTARQKLEEYLEDFRPGTASTPQTNSISQSKFTGIAVGIKGGFGSGKTHLLFQLQDFFTFDRSSHTKAIYSKAGTPNLLEIYTHHFMGNINSDDLKNLIAFHFAKLLRIKEGDSRKSSGEQTLTQVVQNEVERLIHDNPQAMLKLVEQDFLPIGDLSKEFDSDFKSESENFGADFFQAYSKITDPNLGQIALKWIKGFKLTEVERKNLGLALSAIEKPNHAKEAFLFLLGAFNKAEFPLMFCLDEFERFALSESEEERKKSSDLLKDLAEIFKHTGHCLIICGVSDAWDIQPSDVLARIKPSDIIEIKLAKEEAEGVLEVYSKAAGSSLKKIFDSESLEFLYGVSNANIRQLLDLANQSFDCAQRRSRKKISVTDVKEAANNFLSVANRIEIVDEIIRPPDKTFKFSTKKDKKINGRRWDYVINNGKVILAVIEIKRSIFKIGEIGAARDLIISTQDLKKSHPNIIVCLILVGYSSQEIRQELASAVDKIFYYGEQDFEKALSDFLGSLESSLAVNNLHPIQKDDAYEDLLLRLKDIEETRQLEIMQLTKDLKNIELEVNRTRKKDEETRVYDKILVLLAELKNLLDKERELVFRFQRIGYTDLSAEDLDLVLKLLDEQQILIKRANILNRKTIRDKDFAQNVKKLGALQYEAINDWVIYIGIYDEKATKSELKAFQNNFHNTLNKKQELVDLLEIIYSERKPADRLEKRFNRFFSLQNILMLLSLLILTVFFSTFILNWLREKDLITNQNQSLSKIQENMRMIEYNPDDVGLSKQKEAIAQSIIEIDKINNSLRDFRYADIGISNDINAIEKEIQFANSDILPKLNQESSSFSDQVRRMRTFATGVIRDSRKIQDKLAAISFLDFAATFFLSRGWLLGLGFLPLIYLLAAHIFRRKVFSDSSEEKN